jgi:hypothetical protein
MDDGFPIAYEVLERNVPVYSSDDEMVGTVDHVVSAPEEDIFHGVVAQIGGTPRLILAEDIESLHEHGVHLRIDAAAAAALEAPHGAAPAWRVREPGLKPSRWNHFVEHMVPGETRRHNWNKLD